MIIPTKIVTHILIAVSVKLITVQLFFVFSNPKSSVSRLLRQNNDVHSPYSQIF